MAFTTPGLCALAARMTGKKYGVGNEVIYEAWSSTMYLELYYNQAPTIGYGAHEGYGIVTYMATNELSYREQIGRTFRLYVDIGYPSGYHVAIESVPPGSICQYGRDTSRYGKLLLRVYVSEA